MTNLHPTSGSTTAPSTAAELVAPDVQVERLASGFIFTEGPVWSDEDGGFLLFSDIAGNEIRRWDAAKGITSFRKPSNNSNGNFRDLTGRLVTCEHGTRRVTRTEPDGSVTTLADRYLDKRLTSPNDLVVKSDGTIWFTDPPYGLPKGVLPELDKFNVFVFDPMLSTLRIVADDLDRPNGLCFSPDESRLYVADSGKPHLVRVYDVVGSPSEEGTHFELRNGRDFATITPGVPDGIRCDRLGNLWSTAGDGVIVFDPQGREITRIKVPETPANLCFGGLDRKTVFVTARTSLYRISVRVAGAK